MGRTYYAVRYRLDNRDRYLIWFAEERTGQDGDCDGVVVDKNMRVPTFASLSELQSYTNGLGISVETEDPAFNNFDTIAKWLTIKRLKWNGPTEFPCNDFLDAWHLFADISRSIGGTFDSDKERNLQIYRRIFWGSNIPALTPEGEHWVPFWPNRQKRLIRQVMSQGLKMFRECARRA